MPKRLYKISCLAIMAILFLRIIAYSGPDPSRFNSFIKTNWYGLYMQGSKIGYVSMSLEKVETPLPGWQMRSLMTMAVNAGNQQMTMTIDDIKFFVSPGGELYSSKLRISSPTGNITVEGRTENEKFIVESNIGGQVGRKSFDYPLDNLDNVLYIEKRIASGRAAVGDSLIFATFEATPPLTGLIHERGRIQKVERLFFNGITSDAYEIDIFIDEMNFTAQSKIDSYGNILEGSFGGGMLIRLEGETLAKQLDQSFDFLSGNLVIPDKKIDVSRSLESLKIRISGIDTSEILQTGMQTVRPDDGAMLVEITKRQPPQNAISRPIFSEDLRPFLSSDPYEQSDDPQIIKLAQDIVGDEKNSWQAARKINNWVYQNIEKRFTPDFSNALQTLHSRSGDCGEHTALAVALLRAAGIPARPIVGLIYWPPGNGFGYHAWTDVYVGQWTEMDPSWGEDLANPTHIALARGGIISQATIVLKVLGKVKIEILETKQE